MTSTTHSHSSTLNHWYLGISAVYLFFLLLILLVFGYTPTNDGSAYIEFAQCCLATGDIYPNQATIMGEPFVWNIGQINLVELSLWLSGSVMPVVVLMCVLKATTAYLVALTGAHLFSPRMGLSALLLYVCYPNNWGQSTTLLSEIPTVCLCLSAFYLVISHHRVCSYIAAGLLFALSNWFRSTSLIYIGALTVYYLLFDRRQIFRRMGSVVGAYTVLTLLIGTSCYLRTGYFITHGNSLWFNFVDNTYIADAAPHYGEEFYPKGTARYIANLHTNTAMQNEAIWRERSLQWLSKHKVEYLCRIPLKIVYLYVNDMDNIAAFLPDKSMPENNYVTFPLRHLLTSWHTLSPVQWVVFINLVYYYVLLLLFIVSSLYLLRKRLFRTAFLPLFIVVGASVSLMMTVHAEMRHKAIFMPFIFMVAPVIVKEKHVITRWLN